MTPHTEAVTTDSERLHIVVAERAMPDPSVAEVLFSFDCAVAALGRALQDPVTYQSISKELCRLSRRVIWSFVNSVCCSADQVGSAASQFADAADLMQPERATDVSAATGFQAAVRGRAVELRAVLDEYPPADSGFVRS